MTTQPSDEALGYQRQLLALLGEDDPVAVQAATLNELRRLVTEAGSGLRRRPAAGEWSVLELVGHIVDAEIVSSGRYRFILAHDLPDLPGYDQDAFAAALRHNEVEPDDLLLPFETLRAANIALWGRTPTDARARVGLHAERGPESYDLTFRMIAGHDRFHLDQARSTIAAVRGGATAGDTR